MDNDPRWLRPKTREEMDERISGLSNRKVQRKLGQKSSREQPDTLIDCNHDTNKTEGGDARASTPPEDTLGHASSSVPVADPLFASFSETPLQDLFQLVPQGAFGTAFDLFTPESTEPECSVLDDLETPEELLFASSIPSMPLDLEQISTTSVRRPAELWTVDEESLLSTDFSTTSLKRRLSKCSTLYLKAVALLLKEHSLSEASNSRSSAALSRVPTYSVTVGDGSTTGKITVRPPSSLVGPPRSHAARVTLPNSLLLLDRHLKRQGLCLPGFKGHDSGHCWCLDGLDGELWVNKAGIFNPQSNDPPESLDCLDLEFRDPFGNNVLHMLAARGAAMTVIIEALEKGVDGNAKNNAGQTFLHMLPRRLLETIAGDWYPLTYVLQKFNSFNVRFHDCDIFGRSFFHLLTRQARKLRPHALGALSFLNVNLPPTRDAFGWISTKNPELQPAPMQSSIPNAPGTRSGWSLVAGIISRSPYIRDSPPVIYADSADGSRLYRITVSPPSELTLAESETLMYMHARMLETAWMAIDAPETQDIQGRNGLQCVAEAFLSLDVLEGDAVRNTNKRKRGQSNPKAHPTKLKLRQDLARKMIAVGVDVNNYDVHGNTVLMAFVAHLPDGEDDKTVMDILNVLIDGGSLIDRRNRKGETALHVAVRLGKKVATRVLLARGANVHVRAADGKGVLALGEAHYFKARDDSPLYASILGCMALCIKFGAVAAPTLVHEWSTR